MTVLPAANRDGNGAGGWPWGGVEERVGEMGRKRRGRGRKERVGGREGGERE